MDFLGFLGPSEMIVVAIVTLIVFGPNRMPELARHLAKLTKLFREASRELQRQIDMSDIQRELNKPPETKSKTTKSTSDDYSYPYGEEDEYGEEENYYNDMGKEDTNTDSSNSSSSIADDEPEPTPPPVEAEEPKPKSSPRLVVDEDLKTRDAERLQREFID